MTTTFTTCGVTVTVAQPDIYDAQYTAIRMLSQWEKSGDEIMKSLESISVDGHDIDWKLKANTPLNDRGRLNSRVYYGWKVRIPLEPVYSEEEANGMAEGALGLDDDCDNN